MSTRGPLSPRCLGQHGGRAACGEWARPPSAAIRGHGGLKGRGDGGTVCGELPYAAGIARRAVARARGLHGRAR